MFSNILNKAKAGGLSLLLINLIQTFWPEIDTVVPPGWQEVVEWIILAVTFYFTRESDATLANVKPK